MRQQARVTATTDIRRSVRTLRALFLLGGFVVLWWCLATGTAQASETPRHDLRTTTKALGDTADRVVHRTVERAVRPVHRAAAPRPETTRPAKVTQAVRHHVAPVRAAVKKTIQDRPVRSAVAKTIEQSPVKPVVATATEVIRTQVVPVLEQTRSTLSSTPLGSALHPVLDAGEAAQPQLPIAGESAVLPGESHSKGATITRVATPDATVVADHSAAAPASQSVTAEAHQDAATPSAPLEQRGNDQALRSLGSTGASSAQSGSGSGPGATTCEAGFDLAPSATKTSISAPAGRPSAGPAYPPSCSPD